VHIKSLHINISISVLKISEERIQAAERSNGRHLSRLCHLTLRSCALRNHYTNELKRKVRGKGEITRQRVLPVTSTRLRTAQQYPFLPTWTKAMRSQCVAVVKTQSERSVTLTGICRWAPLLWLHFCCCCCCCCCCCNCCPERSKHCTIAPHSRTMQLVMCEFVNLLIFNLRNALPQTVCDPSLTVYQFVVHSW